MKPNGQFSNTERKDQGVQIPVYSKSTKNSEADDRNLSRFKKNPQNLDKILIAKMNPPNAPK